MRASFAARKGRYGSPRIHLIISSGGNSGSQASTLVIRALAVGELRLADPLKIVRREPFSGLALGCILAVIGFLRISIWSAFSNLYGGHWVLVATTVALALVGMVLWGSLVGSILSFVLRRLGFDPATSSAPFVAAVVDVTGRDLFFRRLHRAPRHVIVTNDGSRPATDGVSDAGVCREHRGGRRLAQGGSQPGAAPHTNDP